MLTSLDKEAAASPARPIDEGGVPALEQLLIIGAVGVYLLGVVWFYVTLPWVLIGVTAVAAVLARREYSTLAARRCAHCGYQRLL
ncbi:MAG: hypothetical protein KJP03_07435 [Gammaproteobacteria bacterium]|nr:hypothetical protein [Gammaproteobacteria bacterium]